MPVCGASVGPDVAEVVVEPLLQQWHSKGQPLLENPGAGWNLQSIASIVDMPQWIQTSQPSHLELAYLGQQMWKNIESMLMAMKEASLASREGA